MNAVQLINPKSDFRFEPGSQVGYPMPPLISAEISKDNPEIVIIRATVFISAQNTSTPTIVPGDIKDGILSCNVIYDSPEDTPVSYKAWYGQLFYEMGGIEVDKVRMSLTNADPITSRGTVTTVQR